MKRRFISEATTETDCESENGICAYLMFEELCEYGLASPTPKLARRRWVGTQA